MKTLNFISMLLLVVGGLNWGLYSFGTNLVSMIFGAIPMLEKIIYLLVALSALYNIKPMCSSLMK